MSTNNKENLIQIPESIENAIRDHYKAREDKAEITKFIDSLHNFEINDDNVKGIRNLKELIDTFLDRLRKVSWDGLFDNSGIEFLLHIFDLDKQYKIGVDKSNIGWALLEYLQFKYDDDNLDWEKVTMLCFKLFDEVSIDQSVIYPCFYILGNIIKEGVKKQLPCAKKIFDSANKAMEYFAHLDKNTGYNAGGFDIPCIAQALFGAVNKCNLEGLNFDNIVECISQLIKYTSEQCEPKTLNYMCQTLVLAIKKYENDKNIEDLINDKTLGLIKKIFGKVVIRSSNDIKPLIEMSHTINVIIGQYRDKGGKKFELFETHMGLKYNDNNNLFDRSDNNKLKEFLGNDIYRILDQVMDNIAGDRIEIYEKIRLCVSDIDVNGLDQQLEKYFYELNSMICQYDNSNTALCLLDIEIVVDLIEKSLDKAIAKDDIITIKHRFNALGNAVANICEKANFIMELDDAGKVLDCLDKVFENANKITLNTTVFEVMFASLYNVVLNI